MMAIQGKEKRIVEEIVYATKMIIMTTDKCRFARRL